jgi:hypothetical protein
MNHLEIMTDSLNTPEKREETLRWLKGFHSASDALDAATWVQKYFTEDAIVQFADSPQVKAHGIFINIQSKIDWTVWIAWIMSEWFILFYVMSS